MALQVCGALSGRTSDKVKVAGLTPVVDASGGIYFQEARLVLILKKLYFTDIDPAKALMDLSGIYPEQDYHRLYIGEIVKVLRKG